MRPRGRQQKIVSSPGRGGFPEVQGGDLGELLNIRSVAVKQKARAWVRGLDRLPS